MIAIVDYKAGNLASVKKAFDHLGAETVVTADPVTVQQADKIVLPGVGHFAATRVLGDSGLREAIIEQMHWVLRCCFVLAFRVHSRRIAVFADNHRAG